MPQTQEETKNILIVEDDPFISDMYASKLRAEDFNVLVAENGKVALDAMKTFSPHIILLDVVMPHLDGFEMLKLLKKDEKTADIPVILLTNLGQKDDVEQGLALGASDYIVKAHFTPTEVIEKVKESV